MTRGLFSKSGLGRLLGGGESSQGEEPGGEGWEGKSQIGVTLSAQAGRSEGVRW